MRLGKTLLAFIAFLVACTDAAQKPSTSPVNKWVCASGWQEKPKSHKCYKVFPFSSEWRTGLNYCSTFGGRLAIIDSLDTQNYLANLLNDYLQQPSQSLQRSSVFAWIGLMYIDDKFHWVMGKQTQDNYKTGFYSSSVKSPATFHPESQGPDIYRWAKGEPNGTKECGALHAINNASDLYDELVLLGWHGNMFNLACSNTNQRKSKRVSAVICETQQQQQSRSTGGNGNKKDQDKIEGDLVSLDPNTDNPLQGDEEAQMASVGDQSETTPPEWSVATQYWQSGVVPYVFETKFKKSERRQLSKQMQLISENCKCVKFIPRASEPDYLKFERILSSSCAAKGVGWIGGEQKIVIGPACFQNIGLVIHELLHILGMPHEHQRPDRDRFIKVNLDNVEWRARRQFAKFNETLRTRNGYDYDFESIMHYPPNAFSFLPDKFRTIQVNLPANSSEWREANKKLQQAQTKLSELDRIKLNKLYCATSGSIVTVPLVKAVSLPAPPTLPIIPGPSNPNDLNNNNNIAPAPDTEIKPPLPCGYWQNGEIPYLFDGNFKASEIKRAEEVFAHVMSKVCGITFRRKQAADVNYVLFTHSEWENYCYAQGVGKCGGVQRVFFGSNCVMLPHNKGRFLHELLHLLGLQHEFQRPDRDKYIIVNEDNIPYNDRHSYAKYESWLPGWNANSTYDFDSVLHYVNDVNIQVRPEQHYSSLLGTRLELSQDDVAKLNRLYPKCKPTKQKQVVVTSKLNKKT